MIKIFKLSNGTEIIGDVESKLSDCVNIKRPYQINYRFFYGPLPSVSLSKYIMFTKDTEIKFNMSDIINEVNPREPFINFYLMTADAFDNQLIETIDKELEDNVASFKGHPINQNEEQKMKKFLEDVTLDDRLIN